MPHFHRDEFFQKPSSGLDCHMSMEAHDACGATVMMERMYRIIATALFLVFFIAVCFIADTFLRRDPQPAPFIATSSANNLP